MSQLEVQRTREDVKARMAKIEEELGAWEIYTHEKDALVLIPKAQRIQAILKGKREILTWFLGENEG